MAEDLKLVETGALLMLLDAGQEVPNTYLTERKFDLKADGRRRLEAHGLIDVRKEGGRVYLGLSDKGWARALKVIAESAVPAGSGYRGAVIHQLAGAINRYLDRTGTPVSEFFAAAEDAEPEVSDVTDLIRKTYGNLAARPGDQVSLARLRAALPNLRRSDLDDALITLSRDADVWIDPESDQKSLTDEERKAAVSIGNQDKHQITIVRR